ncbi:hypothetical protein [Nonomuraea sp. NPDC048826]|uniref:hypothetical protein n=1 Tax=Nonomuraea sp. NPDC048826 TaxID=3364347 RepID=UPI00372368F5
MDDPLIVCDMTTARDTPEERLAEYGRLFGRALTGRERTGEGIRFRLRAEDGLEEWVRDLAAREKACCAFFSFEVTATGDEVVWDAAVPDDEAARAILEEFYLLPETSVTDPDGLRRRLEDRGLRFHGS